MSPLQNPLRVNWIVLALSMIICVTQAKIELRKYKKLETGQNITGTKIAEIPSKSKLKCSDGCSRNDEYGAYQYTTTGPGNCLLIHRSSPVENGLTFISNGQVFTYNKVCLRFPMWNAPSGCPGPAPEFYMSFDCLEGLDVMEGATPAELDVLTILGKKDNAVSLNHTRKQWVDLGIWTEACITRPETCDTAGAAVAFWIRRTYYDGEYRGVISSRIQKSTGVGIYFREADLRFAIRVTNGQFIIYTDMGVSEQWTHVVLNYFGPDSGQGIQVYFDGVEAERDTSRVSKTFSGGNGRVVLGRQKTDSNEGYGSADLDELLIFNTKLSNTQVGDIINMT